jgi:hypothetical protein
MTVISAEIICARICSWSVSVAGYLSAGKLLHAITVAEVLTILSIATMIGQHALAYPILTALSLFPLFTQLDARSRFQEYKQVWDQLARYGPDRRIFKSVASSRCQRDAALAAARQLGYAKDCRSYFCAAGYRWYHLLPDFATGHPRFLISAAFWRKTFFMPTYQARTLRLPITMPKSSIPTETIS